MLPTSLYRPPELGLDPMDVIIYIDQVITSPNAQDARAKTQVPSAKRLILLVPTVYVRVRLCRSRLRVRIRFPGWGVKLN